MALFNYATKEITLKIVYYGPGLSGKTTNLQYLHSILNPETKGKLLSLSTEADRTLFFDFLPVDIGKIRDFSIRFQLYTVPGQVRYNATRKVVLKGADAVIFVADSQREMREQNIESFENMMDNLRSNNINPDEIPIILQYNKRDLQNILSIDEFNSDLNSNNYYFIEASAINGAGVEDSYKLITKLLLKNISKKHKIEIQPFTPAPPVFESSKLESSEKELVPEYELEERSSVDYSYDLKAERSFEEKAEQIVVKEIKEIKEVPVIPIDKINLIIDELEKITGILSDIKDSFSTLNNFVSILNKEMKEMKEIKKEQKETNTILRDIMDIFDKLKTKKSWFKF